MDEDRSAVEEDDAAKMLLWIVGANGQIAQVVVLLAFQISAWTAGPGPARPRPYFYVNCGRRVEPILSRDRLIIRKSLTPNGILESVAIVPSQRAPGVDGSR